MDREVLHQLVERIPEPELMAAQRYLEYLENYPAYRAGLSTLGNESVVRGERYTANKLEEIAKHCASLPVLDARSTDEILGYDEHGLPR